MKKPKIAIVVQRYGEEVNGGAELLSRWLAEHLLPYADVHTVTSCAVDFTWEDKYKPGESVLNGVTVHRFPVDKPRDLRLLQKYTHSILFKEHTLLDEINWVKEQGPFASGLFSFLQSNYREFDAFIFSTYLYATTYFGLPLVSDKAILVPNGHDEPYLHLPVYRHLFHLPQAIVYNTESEKNLVNKVTQNGMRSQDIVAGIGINVPLDVSAERFRQKFQIEGDFLLYAGRIIGAKNVPALVEDFLRFKQEYERPLKLVLLGRAHIELPEHPDIVPLGFVSEEDKFDAIQAATVVVMPSLYESLSMIVLEAWLMERPVLVNGRCEVLKHQCRRSNGGLYYTIYDEFAAALSTLLASPELQQKLGQQGRVFTEKNYSWPIIIDKYRAIIDYVIAQKIPHKNAQPRRLGT